MATLAFALGACTKVSSNGATAAGRHPWTVPHVLRYATAEDIVGLNPHLNQQLTLAYMAELTMAWLLRTDAHNDPVPELATAVPTQANGGISADGKTITYHLRKDAKWSDGVPFTADDVVFSTRVVLNPANNEVSRSGWDLITKIDEPDKFTVVYHLKKRYAPFAYSFFSTGGANPCILPKHLLEKYASINDAPYNALPVGVGPFKYASWKRGDSVELVPDPLYFRGSPKLSRIVFKIIPDVNTIMTQLQTHEIDLWLPVPSGFYGRVSQLPGMSALKQPSYFFAHLDFNLSHPVVRERAVRQALRLAIDRRTINDKIAHDLGILSESMISPANPAAVPPIPMTPFSIAEANRVLDAAGWKRGPDGIRAKNGLRLTLNFALGTARPDLDAEVELIRGWWRAIGVSIDVRHYGSPLLFATYQNGGIVYAGKFDVTAFSWGGDPLGDLSSLYECDQIPPNGQNDVRYCNHAVDAAMERFKESYDPKARQREVNFIVPQIVKDVPTIVVDVLTDKYVYNSDLTGFHPNQLAPFDDFLNVDI